MLKVITFLIFMSSTYIFSQDIKYEKFGPFQFGSSIEEVIVILQDYETKGKIEKWSYEKKWGFIRVINYKVGASKYPVNLYVHKGHLVKVWLIPDNDDNQFTKFDNKEKLLADLNYWKKLFMKRYNLKRNKINLSRAFLTTGKPYFKAKNKKVQVVFSPNTIPVYSHLIKGEPREEDYLYSAYTIVIEDMNFLNSQQKKAEKLKRQIEFEEKNAINDI